MTNSNNIPTISIHQITTSSISTINAKKLDNYYASCQKQKTVILNDDCMNVIPYLLDESIDLVITSPPYNVDLGKNKYNKNPYDLYRDNKAHHDYIKWLESIFEAIYPKLKSTGRVAINIGDGKNGRITTHSDIIHFMTQKIGYLPFGHIIWHKNQVGNRCAWGSWCSPSCPSFPTPFEHILIFAKDSLKLKTKGKTDLQPKEFVDWTLAIWNVQPETQMKKIGHPAMFPVEIPYRLAKLLSWESSTILDPFNGAGSTGVACRMTHRNYIGIELSKKYYRITKSRLSA